MKIGAKILAYNQETYIAYCIKALYPDIDSIVVMYSDVPWTKYNPNARKEFSQIDRTWEILTNFPDPMKKLRIIRGRWDIQEDMRNEAVDTLESMNMDYVLIVDADEFYPDGTLAKLRRYIEDNDKFLDRKVMWAGRINHFRRFDWIIDPANEGPDSIEIAFKTRQNIHFTDRRIVGAPRIDLPSEFYFHHFGYVLDDKRMWEKIRTWGHAPDVIPDWFEEKYVNWNPQKTSLCKRIPGRWNRAIKFDIRLLPSILKEHPYFLQCLREPQ